MIHNLSSIRVMVFFLLFCLAGFLNVTAQEATTTSARSAGNATEILFSPRSGTFTEGSTFEVPVLLNTKGNSINVVELNIKFDASKLTLISPSSNQSIIGVWVEQPKYDNVKGTLRFSGVILGGIVTSSGLITTLTFKVKSTGTAFLSVLPSSNIFLNDGTGRSFTPTSVRGSYTLVQKAPEGVPIYSTTHPLSDVWYNNKSPVFIWDNPDGLEGFNYSVDNVPTSELGNELKSTSTIVAFNDTTDGLYYFHVKGAKKDIWGATSHFQFRIDSSPPAEFTPTVDFILGTSSLRSIVSFFTTDAISGVDHYEIGVIHNYSTTNSPVFVQTESPYILPPGDDDNVRVVVRAVDVAGNVRDTSVDIVKPFFFGKFLSDNKVVILSALLLILFLILLGYYVFIHRVLKKVRQVSGLEALSAPSTVQGSANQPVRIPSRSPPIQYIEVVPK